MCGEEKLEQKGLELHCGRSGKKGLGCFARRRESPGDVIAFKYLQDTCGGWSRCVLGPQRAGLDQ